MDPSGQFEKLYHKADTQLDLALAEYKKACGFVDTLAGAMQNSRDRQTFLGFLHQLERTTQSMNRHRQAVLRSEDG